MKHIALLACASAIGMVATAAEVQRGRLMRAPDHDPFPSWRYGPGGQSTVINSEDECPAGWEDHPSKVAGAEDTSNAGTKTATAPANTTTTPEVAAKTTEAKSQTQVDPKVSAQSGVPANGASPAATTTGTKAELDADGHPYDPTLHAGTGSKTKDGKWRMRVGVKRPAPAPGYPLDL